MTALKNNRIILVGCDKDALNEIETSSYEIIGYTSDNKKQFMKYPYLGDIREGIDISSFSAGLLLIADDIEIRRNCFLKYNQYLVTYISNQSQISKSSNVGKGSFIQSNCYISYNVKVGDCCKIHSGCSLHHGSEISSFSILAPGVRLLGNVNVCSQTYVGANTAVKENCRIGSNTIIGMGSNVIKNIQDNVVAYGNPCKAIENNSSKT